jgi:hypothetical protein
MALRLGSVGLAKAALRMRYIASLAALLGYYSSLGDAP